MMRKLIHSLILFSIAMCQTHADDAAGQPKEGWTDVPIRIPARQLDIRSENTGRTHRIFIHVPSTPAPAEGFPVLYLLDGNVTYPLAALLQDGMVERAAAHGITPGIIVGIGYPSEDKISPAFRTEDYTPPAADLSATGDGSGHPQGGADRFLDFIEKELKPRLAADFHIDPKRQTLFGHSYGGLFTLHTLFTRPHAFQGYFAASPSIWWNQRHILTEKDAFLKAKDATTPAARLRLTVGSLEQTPSPAHQAGGRAGQVTDRRQVDNSRDLAKDLRTSGMDVEFLLLENENHGSARTGAVNQALRFAFAAPAR
ncbi:alpha/beta hydrolase-fold protein [Luteolibacter sp. SL250]|uniref:alpha/beta hydrolase n=1 Tax=Luteolibacter sp. SL250 TaxID=2995170 RepID=UPI00226DB780|nr:alpha/beta hydrolase-fold protein [Luteolibacter sp. SL250]WAC19096.1 alpha/beta hydrolase-fold protein [Luteolibacter sp. SL250]